MQLIKGIPTGNYYIHTSDEAEAFEFWDKVIKGFKDNVEDIEYQHCPVPGFKYCFSEYDSEFESGVPVYYVLFARHYFAAAVAEMKEKQPTVDGDIVKTEKVFVKSKEVLNKNIYFLDYDNDEKAIEEVKVYFVKIMAKEELCMGAKFVLNYLTLVYVRLFSLGEPFLHFNVKDDPYALPHIACLPIKYSNEKPDGDRLVNIHSFTHYYNVTADDFFMLGDLEKVNNVYSDYREIIDRFTNGGNDDRQTYMMKLITNKKPKDEEIQIKYKVEPIHLVPNDDEYFGDHDYNDNNNDNEDVDEEEVIDVDDFDDDNAYWKPYKEGERELPLYKFLNNKVERGRFNLVNKYNNREQLVIREFPEDENDKDFRPGDFVTIYKNNGEILVDVALIKKQRDNVNLYDVMVIRGKDVKDCCNQQFVAHKNNMKGIKQVKFSDNEIFWLCGLDRNFFKDEMTFGSVVIGKEGNRYAITNETRECYVVGWAKENRMLVCPKENDRQINVRMKIFEVYPEEFNVVEG